jgi:hypothetical protein
MLSAPSSPVVAAVQAVCVAILFMVFGWLVADVLFLRRADRRVGWGLSFAGLTVYALVLMVLHMTSGGRVFSNAWLTRGLTASVFVLLLARKLEQWRRAQWHPAFGVSGACALGLVATAWIVWGTPLFRMMPLPAGGDISLHASWASQLLDGETTPSGAITGAIPNYYPWLYHGVLALVARLTPGGRALHGLAPLHLMLLAASILALFDLGRTVARRTSGGAAAALLGALTGGVGFVLLRKIDIVVDPRADPLRYMGDLLYKRSYNASFLNLVPPFPRDLAFILLLSFLILFIMGLREASTSDLVWSGVMLGCAGLAGAESFFVGVGTVGFVALVGAPPRRLRAAAYTLGPALCVYALWLVPQIVDYTRLGGYVNLTVVGPVTLPALAILVSWGIATPLAIVGAVRWLPRARREVAVLALFALTLVAFLSVAASVILPEVFGDAFVSLGRPHRYWPLAFLGVALVGALAASDLLEWVGRYRTPATMFTFLALLFLAVPSPVVASLAAPRASGSHDVVLTPALRGDRRALLNLIAPTAGGRCVVAAPLWIDTPIWTYTGYRMVMYSWANEHPGNLARIRWADIYDHITPERKRLHDNGVLVGARGSARRWRRIARSYGVDVVVLPRARADAPAVSGYPAEESSDGRFSVVRLTSCGS